MRFLIFYGKGAIQIINIMIIIIMFDTGISGRKNFRCKHVAVDYHFVATCVSAGKTCF